MNGTQEPTIGVQDSLLKERLSKYNLELLRADVGRGGSARVHQARVVRSTGSLPAVGTLVAVKEYKRELFENEGQLARVQQEADLGSSHSSPNIVRTYGLLPSSDAPEFLLMEWMDGGTLTDWIKSAGDVEWQTLKSVALDIVRGVETMHKREVLHRDLKPENIMLRGDGAAVIMDVGVAELTAEAAETLHTEVGQFLGSMRYASPQYLMGERFGTGDDIYGLGTVLFELFTGRSMFEEYERKTALPIVIAQEGQRVESLREVVPPPIKILLRAAIHRDRARRPQLTDIRAALEDPAGSRFISTELERQTAEERGFPVLKTLDNGMSFFADLGGMDAYLGSTFTVVRRSATLTVPSLSRQVTPEQWVGTATLKHIFQNVGHFVLSGKRWQEGRFSLAAITGAGGHWVEYEQLATSVQPGDWVLKARS